MYLKLEFTNGLWSRDSNAWDFSGVILYIDLSFPKAEKKSFGKQHPLIRQSKMKL